MNNNINIKRLSTFIITLLLIVCGVAYTQTGIPGIPWEKLPGQIPDLAKQIPMPDLNKILGQEAPLTTSFEDALYEAAFMDGYNPTDFIPMALMPKGPGGGFLLGPGVYEYDAQSFCLKAGTHGPSGGEGYLYAPLKGPRADTIHAILKNSADHPDIRQQDIQALLWAIIARTKISDMPSGMQRTASRLLTSRQIFEVNGGALGLLPKDLTNDMLNKLSAPLRRIAQAEANLRSSLTRGNPTYNEIERIAMLVGNPNPSEDRGPNVPRGRWSYHPNGFYIRFYPSGYQRTRVEVMVPDDNPDNIVEVDLPSTVAVPGSTSRQRIGVINRTFGTDPVGPLPFVTPGKPKVTPPQWIPPRDIVEPELPPDDDDKERMCVSYIMDKMNKEGFRPGDYGGQCKSFAQMIFNELFGLAAYLPNKDPCYVWNESDNFNCLEKIGDECIKKKVDNLGTLVASKYENADDYTNAIKTLLANAKPGDVIQVARPDAVENECKKELHTMVFLGYSEEEGIQVYDSNYNDGETIRYDWVPWNGDRQSVYGRSTGGITLYRAANYDEEKSCLPKEDS